MNFAPCICEKGFLDLNFNQAIIDKISNFHEIAPNFRTYSQKSYLWKKIDQLLLPYTFYGRDMWGIYFFILAMQLWAVKLL